MVAENFQERLGQVHALNDAVERRLNLVGKGLKHHVAELVDKSLLLHLLVLGHLLDREENVLLAVPLSVLICRVSSG